MNKKVISLVLSIAMIVSCFACMAGLGVYAVDNAGLGSFLAKSPVKTVSTTAEEKAARTVVDAYPADYPTQHCECGNVWVDNTTGETHYLYGSADACKNDDGNGCDGTLLTWTALSSNPAANTAFNDGGNYYLTKDISVPGQMKVNSNKTARFDLNGYTFKRASGGRMWGFSSTSNVTFTVTDTKGGGKMQANGVSSTSSNQGTMFLWNCANSTFRFYGGTYSTATSGSGDITYATFGAAGTTNAPINLYFFEGAVVDVSGAKSTANTNAGGMISMTIATSKFAAYGATFIGTNHQKGNGGIFCFGNTANGGITAKFVNCTITGGTGAIGGNIFVTGKSGAVSTVDLTNCTVSGGTAGTNGGNICANPYGTVTFRGTTITGGTATNGGNVYIGTNGRFEQPNNTAASLIENGVAATSGGNIYNGYTCILRGTTVKDGTATNGFGGNIYAGAALTLNNATVTGGTASSGASYKGQSIYTNANFKTYGNTSVNGELYIASNNTTARTHSICGTPTFTNLIIGAPHEAKDSNEYFNNTLDFQESSSLHLDTGAHITLTVEADPDYLNFAGQDFASLEEAITRNIATDVTDERAECFTVTNEGYVFVNDEGTGHLAVYVPPVIPHEHAVDGKGTANTKISGAHVDLINADYAAANSVRTYTYAVADEDELQAAFDAFTPTSKYVNIYLTDDIELTAASVSGDGVYGMYPTNLTANNTAAAINICLNGHTITAYDDGADAVTYLFRIWRNTNFVITDCVGTGGLIFPRDNTDVNNRIFQSGGNCRIVLSGVTVTGGSGSSSAIVESATGRFWAADCVFTGMKTKTGTNGAFKTTGFNGSANNSSIKLFGCTVTPASGNAIQTATSGASYNTKVVLVDSTINDSTDGTGRSIYISNGAATGCEVTLTNTDVVGTHYPDDANFLIGGSATTANISGGTISSTTGRAFQINAGNTANATDNVVFTSGSTVSGATGSVVASGVFNMTGGSIINTGSNMALYANNSASDVTLTGVTLSATGARVATVGTSGTSASVLTLNNCTASSSATTIETAGAFYNYGTLNINDGTITGAPTSKDGSVVWNNSTGTVNIYGDAVINGATSRRGAIFNGGTANIYGNATVSGNVSAGNDGGNIYNTGTVNIYGKAVITGGSAARGGNIYNAGGTVAISGNAIIKDGAAVNLTTDSGGQGGGGNIYTTSGGTCTISDSAQIKDGTATGAGGNIYNNATLTITGATVTGGSAEHSAGNIMGGSSSVMTITDATITNGTTDKYGGNIRANAGTLTIEGSTITGGTSTDSRKIGEDVLMNKGTLTIDADSTIGDLATVYPFVDYTIAEGAAITNHEFPTYNGSKSELILVADNTESAFNNWYLLTRGQTKDDGQKFIRFFALVDGEIENYKVAGFTVNYQGENTDLATHDIYKSNYVAGEELPIANYSLESDYYFRNEMVIDQSMIDSGATFTVTAYLEDNEGHVITGPTATVDLSKITFYKATANEG